MTASEMIRLVEQGLAEWVDSTREAVRLHYSGAIARTLPDLPGLAVTTEGDAKASPKL